MARSSSRVKWFGPQLERAVRSEMGDRLLKAADAIADQVRRNISTPSPPASLPGGFPHAASRELLESIGVKTDRRSLTAEVVADAGHAMALELGTPRMAPRGFMRRTMLQCKPMARRILLGPMGGTGHFKFTN